ncbi:MAG: sulfatase-like hydrolase/transferase [Candidatus Hydrogenedentes bacterium]|nr:sulfatase-like hydrolase/transferase [Candidatus Hydrogenedentota bacterium]
MGEKVAMRGILVRLVVWGVLLGAALALLAPAVMSKAVKLLQLDETVLVNNAVHGANRYAFLFMAASALFLASLFAVRRWQVILRAHGLELRYLYLLGSWYTGCFFALLFPFRIVRDAYRYYDVARISGENSRSLAALLQEKMLAIVSFLVLLVPVLPAVYVYSEMPVAKARAVMLLVTLAVLSVLFFILLIRSNLLRRVFSVLPLPNGLRSFLLYFSGALTVYARAPFSVVMPVILGCFAQLLTAAAFLSLLLLVRPPDAATQSAIVALAGWIDDPAAPVRMISAAFSIFQPAPLQAATPFPVHRDDLWLVYWIAGVAVPWLGGALVYFVRTLRGRKPAITPASELAGLIGIEGEERAALRRESIAVILAGALGGLIGGAITGLAEAGWMYHFWLHSSPELHLFWWGPLVYGLCYSLFGVAIAKVLLCFYYSRNRLRPHAHAFTFALAFTVAANLLVIGRFRFARDRLDDDLLSTQQILVLVLIAILGFIAIERALSLSLVRIRPRLAILAAASVALYALFIAGGAIWGTSQRAIVEQSVFAAKQFDHSRPNIILIVADTLRADYLSAYNPGAVAKTPTLDALVKESALFRNTHAQGSWTKPSFATIFTGLFPGVHGAIGKASVLPDEAHTLAETLLEAGYYTQGFPNNRNLLPEFGLGQGFVGFDYLMPRLYFGASLSGEHFALYQVIRRIRSLLMAPQVDREHFYQPAEVVTGRSIEWLEDRPVDAETPFFLYLHYMDPHDPYMSATEPGVGYTTMLLGPNPDPRKYLEPMTRAYNDEIEYLDRWLAPLFDALKRQNLWENSLIIFTSDHGEELFDHRGWSHGTTLYEEVLHVPLIMKLPFGVGAGVANEGMARHIDILPTVLSHASLPKPEGIPGVVLMDDVGISHNAGTKVSYAETSFLDTDAAALQYGSNKLIRANPENSRGLKPVEFYNLQIDPRENFNMSGKEGTGEEVAASLFDALKQHNEEVRLLSPSSP